MDKLLAVPAGWAQRRGYFFPPLRGLPRPRRLASFRTAAAGQTASARGPPRDMGIIFGLARLAACHTADAVMPRLLAISLVVIAKSIPAQK